MTEVPPIGGMRNSLSSGDVTVTHGASGYDIGSVVGDRSEWHLLGTAETWDSAIRKARWYAAIRSGRIWVSRFGEPLQALCPVEVRLAGDPPWFSYDRQTVHRFAPQTSGVYILRAAVPIFVGATDNLQVRLLHHLERPLTCPEALLPLEFSFELIHEPAVRDLRHANLLALWTPPCNQPT